MSDPLGIFDQVKLNEAARPRTGSAQPFFRTDASAKPLTREDIVAMFERLEERDREESLARVERHKAFYATIPESLHGHPLVREVGAWVTSGMPLHPTDAKNLNDRLIRLLDQHQGP